MQRLIHPALQCPCRLFQQRSFELIGPRIVASIPQELMFLSSKVQMHPLGYVDYQIPTIGVLVIRSAGPDAESFFFGIHIWILECAS